LQLFRLFIRRLFFLVFFAWANVAIAVSLGTPQLLSHPGEPLRVEIPIRIPPGENAELESLKALTPSKGVYERLGISAKVLDFNAQTMVYRNPQEKLMVLVETVNPIPVSDDPFLDILVNLNWSSGSLTKTFTLLIGDIQKLIVRPGQSLSEIAAQMAPQYEGATLDQTMLALYKANPDAFASGNINQLEVGSELVKPSQALLRSISPSEAHHFVAQANQEWRSSQGGSLDDRSANKMPPEKYSELMARDRLRIGSSAQGNDREKRYTEELVAQEKELEQSRAKVAELEKNIADLQKLLGKNKEGGARTTHFDLGIYGPGLFAIGLIALTAFLLWLLARNARQSELNVFVAPSPIVGEKPEVAMQHDVPLRTKALLAGIDLDLSRPPLKSANNPMSDTLRVKLNLARAYITIEDFEAARKSLKEVTLLARSIEPSIAAEAEILLNELPQHNI
jgi:pilus assembly protein FimV